jgi:hypothetical protein
VVLANSVAVVQNHVQIVLLVALPTVWEQRNAQFVVRESLLLVVVRCVVLVDQVLTL